MFIFETPAGHIGRCLDTAAETPLLEWLTPDCLNVFTWKSIPEQSIDLRDVEKIDLCAKGFTEICSNVYMKTNEMQTHRKRHDPTLMMLASENVMFTRATDNSPFVQEVHVAVQNWPQHLPRRCMGRRFWEAINKISQRVSIEEDNKRFLSASNA